MSGQTWPSSGNTQYIQNTWEDISNITIIIIIIIIRPHHHLLLLLTATQGLCDVNEFQCPELQKSSFHLLLGPTIIL
jgi:hypothetical protein